MLDRYPVRFACPCSRERFQAAVADLHARIPSLQRNQIIVGMMRIAAMVGDGHTRVVAGTGLLEDGRCVGSRVSRSHGHRDRRDAGEALRVRRVEVHASSLGRRSGDDVPMSWRVGRGHLEA